MLYWKLKKSYQMNWWKWKRPKKPHRNCWLEMTRVFVGKEGKWVDVHTAFGSQIGNYNFMVFATGNWNTCKCKGVEWKVSSTRHFLDTYCRESGLKTCQSMWNDDMQQTWVEMAKGFLFCTWQQHHEIGTKTVVEIADRKKLNKCMW